MEFSLIALAALVVLVVIVHRQDGRGCAPAEPVWSSKDSENSPERLMPAFTSLFRSWMRSATSTR